MTIKVNGKVRSLNRILAVVLLAVALVVTNSAIDAECDHNDQVTATFLTR